MKLDLRILERKNKQEASFLPNKQDDGRTYTLHDTSVVLARSTGNPCGLSPYDITHEMLIF